MPRNQLGFLGNDYGDIERPREGTEGSFEAQARPRANPAVAQLATILFGGTETDGAYVAAFELPDGTTLSATVTRAGGVPATNADLATAMVAAIDGDDAWANVATAVVDGGTPEQVNLTFLHASIDYPIDAATTAAPAPGTITLAITTAAGGAALPVGRFLINVANPQDADIPGVGLPLTTSVPGDIVGLSARPKGQIVNSESTDPDDIESVLNGDMVSVGYQGPWYVVNRGSVASAVNGAVFVVVNPAGGQLPGQVRADDDAANAIELTATQAYWRDAVAPGERGRVWIRL